MEGAVKAARGILVVVLIVLIPTLTTNVLAEFTSGSSGGPEQVNTAGMTAPTNVSASNAACVSGASQQTNAQLSWTDSQSSLQSASGADLVNGYDLLRAASAAGPFATVSALSGSPPSTSATDTSPTGAQPAVAVEVEGTTAGSKTVNPIPVSSPLAIGSSVSIGTVGNEPNAAQVTPDGSTLVVAELLSNQIQVLTRSTGTWQVVATLAAHHPTAVAIDPIPAGSGNYTAYVVSDQGSNANGYVYPLVLNGLSSTLGTRVAVDHQADPTAIAVVPNGSYVYVANYGSGTVSAIPTTGGSATSVALFGRGARPIALAVTADSSHVYVADRANSVIDDIATSSDTVTAHISLTARALNDSVLTGSGDPSAIALSPLGTTLYVAEFGAAQVQVLNTALSTTAPDSVASTIPTGAGTAPIDLAISPNGCLLYVAEWNSSDVFAVNTSTDTLATAYVASTCETTDPQPMEVSPDNSYLFLAEGRRCGQIDALATATNTATTLVGPRVVNPSAIVMTPSPYWYEVEADHFGFISNPSLAVMIAQGWNPGGWQ